MLVSSVACGIGAFVVLAFIPSHGRPASGNWRSANQLLLWELLMLTASVLGVLVSRRAIHNTIGWVFAAGGLIGSLAALSDQWGIYALTHDAPGAVAGVFGSSVGLIIAWGLLGVFLPLLFPDGKLYSRRWRPIAWLGAASTLFWSLEIFLPNVFDKDYLDFPGLKNPIAIPGAKAALELLYAVGLLGVFGAMFIAVVALAVRFFRSHGEERQQLKVVAFTVVVVVAASVLLSNLDGLLRDTVFSPVLQVVQSMLFAAIPAAFGVAILRYRLYDIDVVIKKTLAYGLMAVFITGVYVAVVVGIGDAIGARQNSNLALSIFATALVAVLFQPVRERAQRIANRLVYGERSTPYEVMSAFSRRIGEELSVDEILPGMAETAARGVAGVASRVDVFLEGGDVRSACWPEDSGPRTYDRVVDIEHHGEIVGRLSIAKSPANPLKATEARLLEDLASQAGIALRNVQLAEELQAHLQRISKQAEELRDSRQRIVTAQDSERKRIERDLHDGAQQQLVGLSLTLRMAMNRVGKSSDPELPELLERASRELREAHVELRDLARGIHPAILTDGGLIAAIETLAERAPMPVQLDVSGERYSTPIETAAFFVVSEALANVAKYAQGTSATVLVQHNSDRLRIEVSDDGVGGADPSRGSGLRGLLDRVAALDGTVTIESPPGQGTRLIVELQCG